MPKKKKHKKSKKKQSSLLGGLIKWMFVLGLWGGIFLGIMIAWYAGELPDITRDISFERKASITIKADDGSIITRYGEIRGNSVTVEELPAHLIYAVLAIEDRRFYQHFGLDPLGLARAMAANVKARRLVQGGSTITQQLAKNLFLSHERTIKRKIQEAFLALWLERELTKDEILSAYLNRVYLGAGTYGVDAASKLYFKKSVQNIDLYEAALLAGLLKAPSRYSPHHNPNLAKQRTNIVLKAMANAGYISEDKAGSFTRLPPAPLQKPKGTGGARYFTDWVLEGLDDLIGTPAEDLIIETTLSPQIQKTAESSMAKTIQSAKEHDVSQGAVLVMRPDGAVTAMVGGMDFTASQFNRATQAKRPPGSAFKPILYLTALEKGWQTDSLIIDAPIEEGEYRPRNFNDKHNGEVTLETALMLSLNTASVRLMKETGRRPVIETAKRLGIRAHLEPDLSLALGSSGASLLEMTTAYAVLANGGYAVYPYAIKKITNLEGELYYERPRRKPTRSVVEKSYVQDLTSMMRNVVSHGTGRRARLDFPAAGKTGTSQDYRDAWFIGFTNQIVAGVWMGNDDNAPMNGVTGGSYPVDIWREVMNSSRGKYRSIRRSDFSISGFQGLLDRLIPAAPSGEVPSTYNE